MSTKITQQNINNVSDCLMKNCTNYSGRDFTKHLGHDGDWSYAFDICNKRGKVICLAFFADEIIEVLNINGFELESQVTPLTGEHSNYVCFIFREKRNTEYLPLAEKIEKEIEEEFNHELRYFGIYGITSNKITFEYEVKGGYDYSCGCYWGAMEYVEDIVNHIKDMDQFKNVIFELDEEDLTGTITVEYDASKIL